MLTLAVSNIAQAGSCDFEWTMDHIDKVTGHSVDSKGLTADQAQNTFFQNNPSCRPVAKPSLKVPIGGRVMSVVDPVGNLCPNTYHPEGPVTIQPFTASSPYPYSFALESFAHLNYNIIPGAFFLGLSADGPEDELSCIDTPATEAASGAPVFLPTFPIFIWGSSL